MIDMTVRSGTAENEQHGRCGVASVVKTGVTYAGALQERLPLEIVGVGNDGSTEPSGEDPAALLPERTRR